MPANASGPAMDCAAWPCTLARASAALASAGEILVSSTVRDLVAGSGIAFEDAGSHELKGVPEAWKLYRVVDD